MLEGLRLYCSIKLEEMLHVYQHVELRFMTKNNDLGAKAELDSK